MWSGCSTNGRTASANHFPTGLRNTAAVTGIRGLVLLAVAAVALSFAGAAPAASVTSLERTALAKLKRAPVSAETKSSARSEIARAAHLIRTLPNGRSYHVLVALQEVASFRDALTQPRALALYGALKANDDYFAKHWAPPDSTDIVGADGVVYRYFGGHCFRFHPLANFGVLNARATSGDVDGTQQLADALVARGVYQRGGGIGWEYDFPFSGGKAPWLSGMAQAVAAQAFARAATTVPEKASTYMTEATAAFRVIPKRLMTSVAAGPWIRLYAFSSLTVLNAQLQATISLESYASASGDTQAQTLATRMQNAARGDLDLSAVESEEDKKQRENLASEHAGLAERIKKTLEGKVSDVRVTTRLSESPAVLVLGENDMGAQMRRILEAAGQKAPETKPALEINPTHPLLMRLESLPEGEEFGDLSLLLLEQATLADGGQLAEPAEFVRRLNRLLLAKA